MARVGSVGSIFSSLLVQSSSKPTSTFPLLVASATKCPLACVQRLRITETPAGIAVERNSISDASLNVSLISPKASSAGAANT